MLSVLEILLLVLTVDNASASPLKRFSNSTSIEVAASSTTSLPPLQHIKAAQETATTQTTPQIVTGPTNLILPSNTISGSTSSSSSDNCESMTTQKTNLPKQKGVVSGTHLAATPSSKVIPTRTSRARPTTSHAKDATGGLLQHTRLYGGQRSKGRHTHGTTTLTLFTTVPPHARTNSSFSAAPTSIAASSSVTMSSSPFKPSNYATSSQSAQSSTIPSSTFSLPPIIGPSSSATSAGGPPTSSSPAVWGSLTLTYQMPSSSLAVLSSSSTTSTRRKTRHRQHTRFLQTQPPASTSAFAYPTPQQSSSIPSAQPSSTADAVQSGQASYQSLPSRPAAHQSTVPVSASASDQAQPTATPTPPAPSPSTHVPSNPASPSYQPQAPSPPANPPPPPSTPPSAPPNAPPAGSPSATSTVAPGGITIVPIDPNATTVYITVTTTEPGWTTTVAQQTVTAGEGWWH